MNILTKSGTNDWRGNLYGFFRNQRFDARNPLAPTKDLLTQAQYGASISGPLRRERTYCCSDSRPKTHVWPRVVEMCDPHFQDGLEMTLIERDEKIHAFTAQCSAERSRSEFAFGACTGVRNTCTPMAVTSLSSSLEKMLSRS